MMIKCYHLIAILTHTPFFFRYVNFVDHPTEIVNDTNTQIMNSSMENQNEIFSVEDECPLVEDIISRSKIPKLYFVSNIYLVI